jgi:hypothetical protein
MDLYLWDSLPPSLSSSTNQKKQYKQNGGLQTLSSLTWSAASQNYSPNFHSEWWESDNGYLLFCLPWFVIRYDGPG